MLGRRDLAKLVSLIVLIIAIAVLWLGPYREYCQAENPEKKYCAAYKISVTLGHFLHAYGDAVTALATLAIALFTWTLWRSSEKMWNITLATLRHSEQTAERQLRAYVNVAGAALNFDQPTAPEAHIAIKNFGQTPAYDVRQWIHFWIAGYPLKETLPVPGPEFVTAKSILSPEGREDMVWRKDPPIPAAALPLIGTPQGTIYVYGEIRYRDAFGKERMTRYRLIHGGFEHSRVGFLKPDSEGNEAT